MLLFVIHQPPANKNEQGNTTHYSFLAVVCDLVPSLLFYHNSSLFHFTSIVATCFLLTYASIRGFGPAQIFVTLLKSSSILYDSLAENGERLFTKSLSRKLLTTMNRVFSFLKYRKNRRRTVFLKRYAVCRIPIFCSFRIPARGYRMWRIPGFVFCSSERPRSREDKIELAQKRHDALSPVTY